MKKSTKISLTIFIIILLTIIGVGVYFFISNNNKSNEEINELKNQISSLENTINSNNTTNSVNSTISNNSNSISSQNNTTSTNTSNSVNNNTTSNTNVSSTSLDNYLSVWIDSNTSDSLTLYKIDNNKVTFDLGIYRTYAIDDVIGTLINENQAKFSSSDENGNSIEGTLTLKNNTVTIEATNIKGYDYLNGTYKRTFSERDDKALRTFKNYNPSKY